MDDNFLIAGAGELVVKLKNGKYWTVPFPSENASIDTPGYKFALEKHGGELLNMGEMSDAERKAVRADVEKQLGETVYTHPGSENTKKVSGRFPKILEGLSKITGKLPGILGVLDILGMKKEYDQIMAGEHPSGITTTVEKEAAKVYADGGYVTNNPFVEDIFDN
jgi:hypothetical protein|tara:strand:- start:21 stop:515 length:495 start_codon:yes stop_codon:yes gene_type:complete